MSETTNKIKGDVVDCTFSLAQAIQDAGGALNDRIMDMTVREFVSEIAGQNGIRFTYTPREEGGDEPL